jgi:hypothetical protein
MDKSIPPSFTIPVLMAALLLVSARCGPRADSGADSEEAPPAAAIAPIAGLPLDSALVLLNVELSAALEKQLDNTGFVRFQRAEALTDRLLETRYPFEWLKDGSYAVESKLRQIQALADRVLAEVHTGMRPDSALHDVRLLQAEVLGLRTSLTHGGGPAPPTLEALMAGKDTTSTTLTGGAGEPSGGR